MTKRASYQGPHKTLVEKLDIVAEYEAAPRNSRSAVLRKHNVSAASVRRWTYARNHDLFGPGEKGTRSQNGHSLTPKKQSQEIVRLRRELAKAQADNEIYQASLEAVGKAHALLEKLAESAEQEPLKDTFGNPVSQPSNPQD
ncbi:hypothetical protein [uncultured Arthrobacter sp.]|uniref:hypothetical protein n=1 Tax=uncultured Arthrobacter sp. TaxID=114050 RepID=UPI002627CE7B|nr:hypothetical protein [uncultured Arthrobacter sp.]